MTLILFFYTFSYCLLTLIMSLKMFILDPIDFLAWTAATFLKISSFMHSEVLRHKGE